MLAEIWEPDLTLVFVGMAITEQSDNLGFYHLDPRDRFWELLELSAITPKRMITAKESKALADGHRDGSLSDPVRMIFVEKKTSQLLRLGIGLTDLNRRVVVPNQKDKTAKPTQDDLGTFIAKVEESNPRVLGFVINADMFVDVFKSAYPAATVVLGAQPFTTGKSEVWLLGSTSGRPRGEALQAQEDAFFALGEKFEALKGGPPG
jgi:G:T/U-mismatch repair DNA glycosylase